MQCARLVGALASGRGLSRFRLKEKLPLRVGRRHGGLCSSRFPPHTLVEERGAAEETRVSHTGVEGHISSFLP